MEKELILLMRTKLPDNRNSNSQNSYIRAGFRAELSVMTEILSLPFYGLKYDVLYNYFPLSISLGYSKRHPYFTFSNH